jgi:coronin-1B/1C/6
VKVWQIPEGGLKSNLSNCQLTLSGHRRKVLGVKYHPTVSTLLCSYSADCTSKLWDVEYGQETHSTKPSLDQEQTFFDLVWSPFGAKYVTAMKDKSINFVDARSGSMVASISNAHEGGKFIRLACLGDDVADRVVSVGSAKGAMRQVKIWDPRNTTEELFKLDIDTAPGAIMPFFDGDTGVLYLAGKGDGNIRFYEIQSGGTELFPIGDFKSTVATKGIAFVPKRALDFGACEVARLLKLTQSTIDPIGVFVPRKAAGFQHDIFPDVFGDVPPHSAEQWLAGSNLLPKRVPLVSEGSEGGTTPRKDSFRGNMKSTTSNNDLLALSPNGQSSVESWMASHPVKPKGGTGSVQEQLIEQIFQANKRIAVLEVRLKKAGLEVPKRL